MGKVRIPFFCTAVEGLALASKVGFALPFTHFPDRTNSKSSPV